MKKKKAYKQKAHNQKKYSSYRQVLKRFVACGRCGYFLAGYRALHGVESLEAAAEQQENGSLRLVWDAPTRELIFRSYGVRPEPKPMLFEVLCEECQRRLSYRETREGEPAGYFYIDIK